MTYPNERHFAAARTLALLILLVASLCCSKEVITRPIPDLSGEWVCTKNCSGGEGKVARIVQQGRRLDFTNEFGLTSEGRLEDDLKTVVATQWQGGLKATIEEGGNTLHWANGSIWVRKTSDKTSSKDPLPDLNGVWIAEGYTCDANIPQEEIRIQQTGISVVATKITGDNCVGLVRSRGAAVSTGIRSPAKCRSAPVWAHLSIS